LDFSYAQYAHNEFFEEAGRMMKTMKLSVRMALAFGLLLGVILLLSIIGIVSMAKVGGQSTALATENVPEISVANEIERHALSMMPSLHDYSYTDDAAFLAEVQAQLAEVKTALATAKTQGEGTARLDKLKEAAVAGKKPCLILKR
jgi:hypothetical protein